jgi:hypothetical protein
MGVCRGEVSCVSREGEPRQPAGLKLFANKTGGLFALIAGSDHEIAQETAGWVFALGIPLPVSAPPWTGWLSRSCVQKARDRDG